MPETSRTISPAQSLEGTVALPGDKSIAHRSALLSAIAESASTIHHFPDSADPQSTLGCLRQLGVSLEEQGDGRLRVQGRGKTGLRPPDQPLDCGNAGTAMRLLAGLMVGQPFGCVLTGDDSLKQRPMERIAEPLRAMGATMHLVDDHAPIRIRGGRDLHGIEYRLPVASAQVKSCVLLAALYADTPTTVIEPTPSRDHTERMLDLNIDEVGGERAITVAPGHTVPGQTWVVPGDFSAAAFFLVAGTIVPDSTLRLEDVGLNPSRTAFLEVLRGMGADLTITDERTEGGEPVGTIVVRSADLEGVSVGGRLIPNLIDEVPILGVAAACARGTTEIRDAEELRVKETDRLDAMARNLRSLGARVTELEDGLTIKGTGRALRGNATVRSFGDHRIAMAMGVASLAAASPTQVVNADCARVSFPGFWNELDRLAEQAA
jgi:3-phosphoshikimate 1-carboxyvinyltransferase